MKFNEHMDQFVLTEDWIQSEKQRSRPYEFSFTSFLKTVITIAEVVAIIGIEVAASLVTGGMAAPIITAGTAMALNVGVGLAAETAIMTIDISEGKFSWLNTSIGFGAIALPIVGGAINELRAMRNLTNNMALIKSLGEGYYLGKTLRRADTEYFELLEQSLARQYNVNMNAPFEQSYGPYWDLDFNKVPSVEDIQRENVKQILQELQYIVLSSSERGEAAAAAIIGQTLTSTAILQGKLLPEDFAIIDQVTGSMLRTLATSDEYAQGLLSAKELRELFTSISTGQFKNIYREGVSPLFRSKNFVIDKINSMAPSVPKRALDSFIRRAGPNNFPRWYTDSEYAALSAKSALVGTYHKSDNIFDSVLTAGFLNKDQEVVAQALFRSAAYLPKSDWNVLFDDFVNTIDPKIMNSIMEVLRDNLTNSKLFQGAFSAGMQDAESLRKLFLVARKMEAGWTPSRLLRITGSNKFNKYVTQTGQRIDANDIARAPVEHTYQFIKTKINKIYDKVFEKIITRGNKVLNGKTLLKYEKVKKRFIESGGRLCADRYLMGFKVMKAAATPLGDNFCVMFFNIPNTEAFNYGKNLGGKKPVLFRATDTELKRLEKEKSDYWWSSVGKTKGWWLSRGGHRTGSNALQLGRRVSLFLMFFPINAFRNVGSIASNWIENITSMSDGSYFKTWKGKFISSIERSAIMRTGRLTSRVILGGALERSFGTSKNPITAAIANTIPRELQRGTSLGIRNVVRIDKKTGHVSLRASTGAVWGHQLMLAGATSVKSAAFRYSRIRTKIIQPTVNNPFATTAVGKFSAVLGPNNTRVNTYARQITSTKRKLNQLRRIPTTITPNKVLSPTTFGKIKIKK